MNGGHRASTILEVEVATRPAAGPRQTIRRRLRSLAAGELVNIPLQAGLWFGVVGLPATLPNLMGYAIFVALLIEGACYWLAKLRQLGTGSGNVPAARIFSTIRAVNVPLLAIGVVVAAYAAIAEPGIESLPGLGFALFAVLEHVNYFHVQLVHRLRPSHLARDLKRHYQRERRD